MLKNFRWIGLVLAAALYALPASAETQAAQAKITIGTAGGGTATAALYAAKEEGYFGKRGLDVSILMGGLDSNMPSALLAHSLEIAATSTTTFFQAIEGGLDLVVILGGTATSTRPTDEAVLAAKDSFIHEAKDFVGRKVGVPGIGAALHVLYRYWLTERGVDFHKVDFAETQLPRMRDLLAAKTVDAVVAVNPFIGQIVDAGVGTIVVPLAGQIPSGKPVIMYVTTRDWADQHKSAVATFRAAIIEGAGFVAAEPDRTKEDINRYAKLPPQVLKAAQISDQSPKIDTADLAWWFDVMKRQGMLTHDMDVNKLLYP
ncbi:MAG TPA: ABC transporter substrate-binding protein [Stellaceae bacterium]|nr:ABC transporter substrate-binding protein [Stellaceae bacterium]